MSDNPSAMSKRNLLICFDAFGTLFAPKRPVAQQYGEVARALGLSEISDDEVQSSFKTAYKNEVKRYPNFGKVDGLNPEIWWSNIIQNTFQPLLGSNQQLPPKLIPKLLHRFWSNEGYVLLPDVQKLLDGLRNHYRGTHGRMVVGVITNSDPRVPDVLSSLGLRVSPLRYGSLPSAGDSDPELEYDIDFSVMSYDVGREKPDKRIFAAAEEMLQITLQAGGMSTAVEDSDSWRKVYVGDEYDKDVVGATSAGWNAVLVDGEGIGKHDDVKWFDDDPAGNLQDVFNTSKAVGFSSLGKLARWLPPSNG